MFVASHLLRLPRQLVFLSIAVCGFLAAPQIQAQTAAYPNRSIRIIVPFPAGGPTDILARVVGQKMSDQMGQAVVVDNRPGANTGIGANAVANAAADGYTLLMAVDNTLAMNQFLYSKLPYDPLKDFEPVGKVAVSPLIIVTSSQGPGTMQALLAHIKKDAGKLSYGHGTFTTQFAGEMLKREVGRNMVDVPYKGSSAVTQGLLTNDVLFTIDGITAALPHIQKGSFRALAKLSDRSLPSLPQIPTLRDEGLKLPSVEVWMALVAPKGTPMPTVERLNRELLKALGAQEVQQKLSDVGLLADGSTPAALRDFIAAEAVKWKPVIEATGIKID
jgi:tripartite-type tricarboxylate transporter receptor subunit TctC